MQRILCAGDTGRAGRITWAALAGSEDQPPMTYLYSLYDALVSIDVPADKARAVVDAMERDMQTTLATKSDLAPFATRDDLLGVRQEVALLQKDLDAKYLLLRQEFEATRTSLRQEIESSRNKTIIWLGSALVVASSSIVAAVRLL
jgi:hypothetical protein